ncbi:hypothetical protein EUTSA_v10005304mg, partial [Eutrema salsugineum]
YAIGRMKKRPKIYGTQATMNVWHPHIEGSDEFSLGQIWLTSGSYNNNDVNSIEAGWQVYPYLYHDYQPRFFIYWTVCFNSNTTRIKLLSTSINWVDMLYVRFFYHKYAFIKNLVKFIKMI